MKSRMIVSGLILLLTGVLSAQMPFNGAVHFSMAFPQDEFGENLDATGFGGGGSFLYQPPGSFVAFGLGLDFYVYGSETRKEPWSLTIPDVYLEVTRTNSIFQGFLMMRLVPPAVTSVRPYIDGLFGFNYLSTSTSVKSNWDDKEIASDTNFDDSALAYGGGGGLLISVYRMENSPDPEDRDINVAIDLGFRYLKGGEAEYLKKGDVEIVNQKVIYHSNQSYTDLFTVNIGVNVSF